MKATSAAILASLCASVPALALAQNAVPTTPVYGSPASAGQSSGSGITMPYQRNFWGHVGLSAGRSELDARCPAGLSCDDNDTAWRIYGGGRFNNVIGGELGYVNFGEFSAGPGSIESHGIDLALVAGVPFGTNQNWSVFGKLGVLYSWTDVGGIPGIAGRDEEGFGGRYGVGLQMGITQNWAVRADWDRYRIRVPGEGRENVDTLMVGAQYTFR